MDTDLPPIDRLDSRILELRTRINATTYELLVMIREFDERAGWVQWGLANCAEWLAWRCDLCRSTAREKIRVAHALKLLPRLSGLFRSGELSYSKVRHLTRVANKDNEDDLARFALRHTAVVVAERCRELCCGSRLSLDTAARAHASRALRMRRDRDRNLMTITVELPIESVKRLCCDGKAVVITENSEGEPLAIGRKSSVVPKAMQRAVRARDNNGCVFPGCTNHRYLHCHHVEHWADGGETRLENLMLLCTKHHTLVHEGGFRIEKDFLDHWCFVRPDGIAVPDVGYVSRVYENPPADALLSVAEKKVSEPPAPRYLH